MIAGHIYHRALIPIRITHKLKLKKGDVLHLKITKIVRQTPIMDLNGIPQTKLTVPIGTPPPQSDITASLSRDRISETKEAAVTVHSRQCRREGTPGSLGPADPTGEDMDKEIPDPLSFEAKPGFYSNFLTLASSIIPGANRRMD